MLTLRSTIGVLTIRPIKENFQWHFGVAACCLSKAGWGGDACTFFARLSLLMDVMISKMVFLKSKILITNTSGSQQRDFETGSHSSAPQVTRNIRRINNRFEVIVLNLDCLLDIKGAF